QVHMLRQCVSSDLSGMPREDIEQVVEQTLSDMPAHAADDFMKALRSLGKAAAPTLQRAARILGLLTCGYAATFAAIPIYTVGGVPPLNVDQGQVLSFQLRSPR